MSDHRIALTLCALLACALPAAHADEPVPIGDAGWPDDALVQSENGDTGT